MRRLSIILFTLGFLSLPLSASAQDTDSDGMPDSHEAIYGCLMANTADGAVDFDTDGMTSLQEYQYSAGLNPCLADTDGDGGPDGWEVINTCLSPLGMTISLAGTLNTAGYSYDVYISGNYAYLADGSAGLQIINISDPAHPTLVGTYNTQGSARGVFVSGNNAYVADGSYGLQIIDVSNPTAPAFLGTYDTSGTAYDVYVSGIYAYVADYDPLKIINVSNPASPTLVVAYSTPGYLTYGIQVSGIYAYVADYNGLQIVDVSTPSIPVQVGSYNTPVAARGVHQVGSYAYIADYTSGLQIINVSNLTNPTLAGSYDTLGNAYDVYVSGDYACVADDTYGLQIINVSNPASPSLAGTYNTPGNAEGVHVSGNYAYVADGFYGLQIIALGDADGDNLSDLDEYNEGTNPCNADPDGDGLTDSEEIALGTDPNDPDTDGDGMLDGWEDVFSSCGLDPLSGDSASDNDLDGLSNLDEFNAGTNPCAEDTDGDSMPDLWEVATSCLNPIVSSSALAQAGTYNTPDYSHSLKVSGDYAYVADGASGLQIIDISDPASPHLVGTYNTANYALFLYVVGNYAYVTDTGSGLLIIDVSNPSNPTLVGSYDTQSYAYSVFIYGVYAYVLDGDYGLQIINISNPANPSLVGTYDDAGTWWDGGVYVSGNYAYIAAGNGLQIINISNPANPTLAGTFNSAGTPYDVAVSGNYAYLADGEAGLQVVNISNPTNPTLAGTYNTSGSAYGVNLSGIYAYVADFTSGVQVINVSNPANPTLAGSYNTPGWAQDIFILSGFAYVADYDFGLQVLVLPDADSDGLSDTGEYGAGTNPCSADPDGDGLTDTEEIALGTDPNNPDTDGDGMDDLWEVDTGSGCGLDPLSGDSATDLDLDGLSNLEEFNAGTNPCTADSDGDTWPDGWEAAYSCFDPLTPSPATITLAGTYNTSGSANKIYVSGNYAYVADYDSGLQIINISNPGNPALAGIYNTPGHALDVYVSGNYAFVADSTSGLQVINVSNPASPTLAGTYDTPLAARGVYISGNYAYVADGENLQILNISNPANPTFVGSYDTPGNAQGIYVSGIYAYVAVDTSGLQIINVSNPATPTFVGSYPARKAYQVYVAGNYAYVADDTYGLKVISVSNPENPTLAGEYDTPGVARGVYYSGSYAYVADDTFGLQVVNVVNPTNPTLAESYDTPGNASGVYISGGLAYVVDASLGLQVIDLADTDWDGLTDQEEYAAGTNPCEPDTDGDGMHDGWEVISGSSCEFDPLVVDSATDYDSDGLTNLQEYNSGTMPCLTDTDGDGMPDGWELEQSCLNPLTPISTPTLTGSYDTPGIAKGVYVSGNYAYVADGDYGLQIINVSDPQNPSFVGTYNTTGTALDVQISGNYAYLAGGFSGLQIIDISNRVNPMLIGTRDTPGYAQAVYVSGNYAYVADYDSGLIVIDVTNPANPALAGTRDTPGSARDVMVSGNYAYVADFGSGLQVINVSNPANPIIVGTFHTADSFVSELYILNGYAFLSEYMNLQNDSRLMILDVENPINPAPVGMYNKYYVGGSVFAFGNYVLANSALFDVSNPANPIHLGTFPLGGSDIFYSDNFAYLASEDNGLRIINFFDTDSDGLLDLDEYNAGSSPCTSDTDGDGLTDIQEVGLGTNPANADTEGDGMDDGWEVLTGGTCGLDPLVGDSTGDNDLDGLNNLAEFNNTTDPCETDTDGDGLDDGDEVNTFLTNPHNPDSDGDGMDDGWEVQFALDPLFDDSGLDPDLDGLTNLVEYQQGTNPRSSEDPSSSCSFPLLYTNTVMPITFTVNQQYVSVELWVSYNDGDYEFTGLSQVATSGTFYYTPAYDDGWYRFHTIARVSAQCAEPPPETPDVEVMFDTAYPSSVCDAPAYASGSSVEILYFSIDSFTGVDSVELYYRKGGSGAYAATGLVEYAEAGFFTFDPASFGGDGFYQFFTLAVDNAGNPEPMKWIALTNLTIDSTPPLSGFTVADGVDLIDDEYWTFTNQLSAAWTEAEDPESDILRYEYAIGSSAGNPDIKNWTNIFAATTMTSTGVTLTNGQQVFTGVRAFNKAGLSTETWSNGVIIDTQPPELISSSPADSEHLGTSNPTITLNLRDEGAGIHRTSLSYLLDFAPVNASDYEVCFGATVYEGATVTGGATCGDTLRLTHISGDTLSQSSHVISVSLADSLGNAMSQSIVFYIDNPSVLRVNPPVAELLPGETVSFTASGGRGSYDWSASGGTPATGNGSSFLYTAGANPGIYTVSVSDDSGASKSVPVTIHGEMEIDPPLANLAMGEVQEFTVTGGAAPYSWSATGGTLDGNTGTSVTYTAGMQTGAFDVTVLDSSTDQLSFSARVNITQFVGRAIIVAGGGPQDSQWDKNENMAKRVFQTLVHRGFTGDKIYFLSNDYQEYWDGDFDKVSDIRPVLPTEDALQAAFDWAAPQVGPNVPLIIYLIDHGGPGNFQLTADKTAAPDQRLLTSSELNGMLDGLQDGETTCRVIVVVEACHSGSFLDDLDGEYDRKVLASSAATELSFLSPEPIFSLYFWAAVQNGFDLKDAYLEAKQALSLSQWNNYQHPQADGNRDGVMGKIGLEEMTGIFIGTDVGTLGSFPEIIAVSPDQVLASVTAETGATVWAQVESVEAVAEVYALVVDPGFSPPSPQDAGTTDGNIVDTPEVDLVRINFTHSQGQEWQGHYNGFIKDGVYTLIIYARDASGQTSLPVETHVTTSQPYLSGEYPARDSVGQAQNVKMQFHVLDAEDGVDEDSLQVWVKGINVTGACDISGTPYDYLVLYTPDPAFGILDSVTVEVYASDYYGNEMVHVVVGETTAPGEIIHFTTTNAVDNDTDGLPDDWEEWFAANVPTEDPDLDGASNLTEFQSGTNPRGADSTPVCADVWEVDDLVSWSSVIVVGGTEQAHNFHDTGDVDWIKFTGVEGIAYEITLFDAGSVIDPVLDVYDQSLASLGHIDDGGLGEGESIVLPPRPDTDVIFIKVHGLNPMAFGVGAEYKIEVTIPGNPFGALFGYVKRPNGNTIENVSVEILAETSLGSVLTNANGKYTHNGVPAGSYTVRATKSGFYSAIVSGVAISDGTTKQLNITLTPIATTAKLTGVVSSQATGAPVSDATVYSIFNGKMYLDNTDNAGVYEIANLPAGASNNYIFNVVHAAYLPAAQTVPVTAAENITVNFQIEAMSGDSDGDGIPDADEAGVYSTNPNDRDTDHDGINDYLEAITVACLDPLDNDSDDDGLIDGIEDGNTNGIKESTETDPCDPDTDSDLMPDGWEASHSCLDPLANDASLDPDFDLATNHDEYLASTDPCVSDLSDTDGDGLTDSIEGNTTGTDPFNPDTDDDGLDDGDEVLTYFSNPLQLDSDGDGLTDFDEATYYFTSPTQNDTDSDGVSDGGEISDGTDPLDENDFIASGPALINYQGRLSGSSGEPVSGPVIMSFSLFEGATGGTPFWNESQLVSVSAGLYSVTLGGSTIIPSTALSLVQLYLEIKVDGETLTPRQQISSAVHAVNSDYVGGKRLESGTRTLSVIPAGSEKTVHVSFDKAFTSTPRVTVTYPDGLIGGETFVGSRLYNVTSGGFDIEWKSLSGLPAAGSATFGYNAFGE